MKRFRASSFARSGKALEIAISSFGLKMPVTTGSRRGRESKIHLALAQFVDQLINADDGWPSESILYRMITTGHAARLPAQHKILAKDMPRDARWVSAGFKSLSDDEKIVVLLKHMPKPPDEKKWTTKEMARYSSAKSASAFRSLYRRILIKIKLLLH